MSSYILGESQGETRRLIAQAAGDRVEEVARWAGLATGMHVIDAGCGPGVVARLLGQIVGPTGSIRGFDISAARIEAAAALVRPPDSASLSFTTGDIYAPPFPAGNADFVFCEFVFEYLTDPDRALAGLVTLLRPGGILLLRDADGNAQTIWPLPEAVESSMPKMVAAMARTGFDAASGRKLYSRMHRAGLKELNARVDSHVTAGRAPPEEMFAWQTRFDALAPLGPVAFGSAAAYREAADGYLAMLQDEGTFRFLNYVAVRGVKP